MEDLLRIILPVAVIALGIWAVAGIRPRMLSHLREMKFMNTSTVQDLLNTCQTMEESGIGDGFRSYVELKGTVVARQPVRTPFSDREVAYCSSKLTAVTQVEEELTGKYANNAKMALLGGIAGIAGGLLWLLASVLG